MSRSVENISQKTLIDVGYNLLANAATKYPKNYLAKLLRSIKDEKNRRGKGVITSIIQNILYATEESAPICQDTGIPAFHLYLNPGISVGGDIRAALTEATVRATDEVPIRKNVIEPFSFINSGTNTGWGTPLIYFHLKLSGINPLSWKPDFPL